jgi:tRNA modification GTPase
MNPDDTIAAISSPPGVAWRGIVRLSGPRALEIADGVFAAAGNGPLPTIGAGRHLSGRVSLGGRRIDAHVIVFRAPRSFTRQDMVEIHLPGAPVLMAMLQETLLSRGARGAGPGEFTARAFLNGALSLSEAHGVAAMVAARSDAQLRAAAQLLAGHLSTVADRAREELADLLSLVEGALDFADEPIEFITPACLLDRLALLRRALGETVDASIRAERWDALPRVVLVGPPNAGKSCLFNRLTGIDRAICAPIAGTTRDFLSAPLSANGLEGLLVDTAGLGELREIGVLGEQRATMRAARDADLILFVVDPGEPVAALPGELAGTSTIAVVNKSDLRDAQVVDAARRSLGRRYPTVHTVSALTGDGCRRLGGEIFDALRGAEPAARDHVVALAAEHREALERACAALDRAVEIADDAGHSLDDADLVSAELHAAADALGTLTGRDATEDLLGRIFSRFCVGK